MNIHDTLMKAADAIERDGWTRADGMALGKVPHCTLGAIGYVTDAPVFEKGGIYHYGPIEDSPVAAALAEYLGVDTKRGLYRWNDDQEDSAPVIEAFRAAAAVSLTREPALIAAEVTC